MGNFFLNLFLNMAKKWLEDAMKNGNLQKFLEDLLAKFLAKQPQTIEQLTECVSESATTAKLLA